MAHLLNGFGNKKYSHVCVSSLGPSGFACFNLWGVPTDTVCKQVLIPTRKCIR